MRYMLVVALILIGTTPASADELLVEACKRATMHWRTDKKLNVEIVPRFLKPQTATCADAIGGHNAQHSVLHIFIEHKAGRTGRILH